MKRICKISLILALLQVTSLLASSEKSSTLVAEAWQAWETNDQSQVERKFLAAISEDQKNTRAYLGLSLLYAYQQKYEASWQTFKNVLQTEQDYYPYVYAVWLTPQLRQSLNDPKSGALALVEELAKKADAGGVLRAMASEVAGEHYQERGDLAKAKKFFDGMNSIDEWLVIGPFDNVSACGFDNVYPPEVEFDAAKTYEGKNGVPAQWFKITAIRNDRWIDHRHYFAYLQSVFYANNFIYSPQKQAAQIRIGTSGSLKAFLNDELLIQYFDENNNDLDTYMVATELQAGWNRLLIKCGFSEIDRCNFMVRITDAQGAPIPGLKVSTETQVYKSKPGAPVKPVENFAETFFQEKIKQHPDQLENYVLLADSYLRNDKAIEAELILREASKRAPNCAMLYEHALEAYRRGEKYDEIETVIEKIHGLDQNVPSVLQYKISQHLENEEYAEVERLMQNLERMLPASETVYLLQMQLYSKKREVEKLLELTGKAYQQYPVNWSFAFVQAAFAIQKAQKYDDAIKIISAYVKQRNEVNALAALADTYLKAGNLKKWEETYRQLIALEPASPGYYFQMANTYFSQQNYASAEQMLNQAIAICPNSSGYWAKLAEVHRIQNNLELAKNDYRQALRYLPTNYDAREKLRALEGKQPILAQFEARDIRELIKNSPGADSYPDNSGVILLSDHKRVVYEQGASESAEELLVRVFNKNGVDDFKEYWIGYNSFSEDLIVEKAVVIKPDGAEIKADVGNNQVVFKSLEENDFIYLKWRIKNFYRGKLSNHFWDTFFFNGFYPIKQIRYSLLAPADLKFQYRGLRMPDTPVKKTTEDGVIYQWELHDEPALPYEAGMPLLEDIGKVLYLTSLPDWEYLVKWYSDLAATKTRSSYEIKEQVVALFPDLDKISEEEKIARIYNFITENIRYSSVPFRQSGLVPQSARDVLVTKIGDCKDVATLCIAMLREVGIEAHHVLVNTKDQGRNENILPAIAFNHCIAGVETKTGMQYLDLTANNYPVNAMPELDIEGFSLLIKPGVRAPGYLSRESTAPRVVARRAVATIREDNSIAVEERSRKTGSLGAAMRQQYRHLSARDREKELAQVLSESFPNVKLTRLELQNLDELAPEVNYVYHFEAPNYVTDASQFKLFKMPWADDLPANEALSYESRKHPYEYWPWADSLIQEIEVKLPAGYAPMDLPNVVEYASPIGDYSVRYSFVAGALNGRRVLINRKSVVSPEEYADFKKFYNNVVKEDSRQILLKKSPSR